MSREYMEEKRPLPIINKNFYIYDTDEEIVARLPKKGWMQKCFMCNMITAKTISYKKKTIKKFNKKIEYDIRVYCCPPCIRKMDKSDKYFHYFKCICNEFMCENFPPS